MKSLLIAALAATALLAAPAVAAEVDLAVRLADSCFGAGNDGGPYRIEGLDNCDAAARYEIAPLLERSQKVMLSFDAGQHILRTLTECGADTDCMARSTADTNRYAAYTKLETMTMRGMLVMSACVLDYPLPGNQFDMGKVADCFEQHT